MTLESSSSIVLDSELHSPPPPPKPRKTYGKRKQDVPTGDAVSEGAMDASRQLSATPLTVASRSGDATGSPSHVVLDTTQNTYEGDSEPMQFSFWGELAKIEKAFDEEDELEGQHPIHKPTDNLQSPALSSRRKSTKSPSPALHYRKGKQLPSSPILQDVVANDLFADEERLVPSASSSVRPSPPPPTQDTPPTSEDENRRARSSKSARNAASHPPRATKSRSVKPLEESRKRKSKLKAPTKKELQATAKDNVRIANERQISLPRTNHKLLSTAALFEMLQKSKQDSDPIQQFSSPAAHPSTSTSVLRKEPTESTIDEAQENSDDDLPDVSQLLEEQKAKPSLRDYKMSLLNKQKVYLSESESDDDLEVVDAPSTREKSKLDKSNATFPTKAKDLDKVLIERARAAAEKERQRKEDEWLSLGGRVKEDQSLAQPAASTSKYVEAGLAHHQADDEEGMAVEDGDEDYDDEDYLPHHYEEEEAGIYPHDEMELSGDEEEDQDRTMVDENDDPDEEEDDEEDGAVLRPRRRAIVTEDSDVEMDENDRPQAILRQESSPSEGRSEEEGDKENEDIAENKENACVTRPAFQRQGQSLHGLEDDFTQNLRMPLGTLEKETSSPLSFMDRLKQDSAGDLQFTPLKFGGESSFSQSSQETLHETPALQPGFDDLFAATTQKPKLQSLDREDTFTRLFGNVRKPHDDDLGLTQDVALQPAFEAEESLKRKADDIFEKEQKFLLRESVVETRKEPELFVDENGFLTQTRPSASTESQLPLPTPSRPSQLVLPTPSLGTQFLSPYLFRQTQERHPLGTLSFTPSQKLHKSRFVQRSSPFNAGYQSSPSPSPSRQPRLPRPKVRLEKSEFVEGEAEESDEDEMRGFGVVHKTGDDEELDGEDQDKNLESLVDDVQMDDETIAAEKVLEKVREHAEHDDQELEKLHKAAIEGKLRTLKRKQRVGFGDDSDDEDDYDDVDVNNQRLRAKMAKKDPKGIADLAQNPETKPFAAAYRVPENDEDLFPIEAAGVEEDDQMEEQEQVSRAEVVREMLLNAHDDEQDDEIAFDPHDVSHVDAEDDDDDQENMVVKVADSKLAAAGASRNRRAVDDDPELEESQFGQRSASNADYLNRMQKWAKDEKRPGRVGASSRSVHSAAITGHKNVKAGAGSVRKGVAKQVESISTGKRKPPVKAAPSLLVGPNLDRSKRFA